MLVVHGERCALHEVPVGFPESPARVERLVAALGVDARFRLRSATAAGAESELLAAIERVHEPGYVARFRRSVARHDGLLDTADNPISGGSFAATVDASNAALVALDAVLAEGPQRERRAFAAIRPPGHHAERGRAMGFCFFNHVAIVAERARDRYGVERIAIVDIDVHHGNGTQHLFEERGDVLYASLHQFPFYPGTGAAEERGIGAGAGATLNVPLAAGSGDEAWNRALADRVVPALERFRPDLLLVSAGFDAWYRDPVGGMKVTEAGFAEWGRLLFDAAERLCGGRAVALLEGGYDVDALPRLASSFLLGRAERAVG